MKESSRYELYQVTRQGPKHTSGIGYFRLALVIFNVFQTWMAWRDVAPRSHTELMQMLEQGKAASATITETTMQGRFKQPQDGRSLFVSVRVDPNAGSTATVSMPTFLGLCRAAGG
jgi:hypothetical protein